MKPLFYFAQCPQLEALEALNWTNGLTDVNKAWVARAAILALNNEVALNVWGKGSPECSIKSMKAVLRDWGADKDIPVVGKMIAVLDGMPIEDCRAAIDYFNQF